MAAAGPTPSPMPPPSRPTTTTTVTPTSPELPGPQPLFSPGDWITLVVGVAAAIIAVVTWRTSVRAANASETSSTASGVSAAAAERSANAAEGSLAEQRRSNDMLAAQHQLELAERAEARSVAQADALFAAGQVTVQYAPNSGIDVVIRNDSAQTIFQVRMIDFTGGLSWRWELNSARMGNTTSAQQLRSGAEHVVHLVFRDDHGALQRIIEQPFNSVVRFTDRDQRRWEIRDLEQPRQVAVDDSDLAPPPIS